ncbi:hypothetical protein [Psychroserpens sp. NJDZ02]|uniref:hypothetical protein n=1 Tax=Psychroserpens sp. NJDZ02 TaxID=2570561 RepID=UPI0010A89427|nr:hypothetical protein [Psychroserpens sp. NJDZ02]QCE42436.1 hypothetical protein E9099_13845 [Psychroserpens sp. NJDZ02]
MQELTQFIFKESQLPELIFAVIFSLGVAIFYSVICATFYKEFKPAWLFFALLPLFVIVSNILFNIHPFAVILFLFLLLVLLTIIGGVLKGVKSSIDGIKKRSKKETLPKIFLDIIKYLILVASFIAAFIYFDTAIIIVIFVLLFVIKLFSSSNTKKFLNLQASLPTSKIKSMAMGLVEVSGQTIMQEPMLSRIEKKECIGYRYKIERKSKDRDGKTKYSTISNEVVCNNFLLDDGTAQVEIVADDIDFLWLEETDSYSSTSKRYTQYLLYANQSIILIGKANSDANRVFIEKEPIKNIFMLAPNNSVGQWNRNKPLLNNFLAYLAVLFLIIAFILISEINVDGDTINLKFNLSWDTLSITKLFE